MINGALSGNSILDEDDFASNSDAAVATQQSIKAYVDKTESHPYATLSDSTTQTITGPVTNAYSITFNTNDEISRMTHSTTENTSRIVVDEAGTYLITFSAIGKSAAPNKELDIWLAVDGSNVPRSNTVSRFVGSANERLITVTYIYTFTSGQYFELYWSSDDSGTTLKAVGEQTNPTRPACPSIILTVNRISV